MLTLSFLPRITREPRRGFRALGGGVAFDAPNVVTLSCTARAHVPKLARRGGCDVRAAISGARKVAGGVPPSELCSTQALQRRTEAGPCQLQRGVSPRTHTKPARCYAFHCL